MTTAITRAYPYRMDCGRRFDNNLPFAGTTYGLPHTCFEDVILVPLATWVLLVLLLALILPVYLSSRKSVTSGPKTPLQRYSFTSSSQLRAEHLPEESSSTNQEKVGGTSVLSTAGVSTQRTGFMTKFPKVAKALAILYLLLVLASLLMNILEIVRLYLADRAAGLLPFTLAGIVLVLILLHLRLPHSVRPTSSLVVLIFWSLQIAFTAVKLATLNKLAGPEPRTGSEYLNSDQQIDVGVYIGLYGIFELVEIYRLFYAISERSKVSAQIHA